MKTILTSACFALGIILAPVASQAEDMDKDRSSPKAFVKDSVITTKIKADFAKDKQVSAMRIHVDTDNSGIVHLSGNAKSQAEIDRAVTIAQGVKGVVSVRNDMQIRTN
jgi:hyperosmotically inducible periplasmic protein